MSIGMSEIVDVEIVPTRTEVEHSVSRAVEHVNGFWSEVKWQIENQAWEVLGLDSFDELWHQNYATLGVRISRDERPELVRSLRQIGQTQAQIHEKTGADYKTIRSDLNGEFPQSERPATITNSRGQERPATYNKVNKSTGEVSDDYQDPEPEFDFPTDHIPDPPKTVTGMDGKQYSKPEPRKQNRRALTDSFFDAAYDVQRKIERLERLTADDRFNQNKEQIALKHKNDLLRAAETLARVLQRMS